MSDSEPAVQHEVDEEQMEQALENTKPLMDAGKALAEGAVAAAARDVGRTPDEQWDRMGDRFAYESAEQNPEQRQLDDYRVAGETVQVKR